MARKKTRERILDTALQLFNEKGIGVVSSKHISDEMGISYGNLCYHFPKKDDIIMQLYLNMQTDLDEQFRLIQEEIFGFDFMVKSLQALLRTVYRYKFIYLDITIMTRRNEEIKKHAIQQVEMRRKMLKGLIEFLIHEGYAKFEKVEGHYDKLVHIMLILLNSWIADSETFYKGSEEDKIGYYLDLFYSFMRPSLTKKGIEAFNQIHGLTIILKEDSEQISGGL
ncbi:MAG: TetR/AcrR family transcriptional regulator [Flammeovirgaceae bacterium]